jgi:hypothetical protein
MASVDRCALCRSHSELRVSHLLPRAIYRDLRMPDLPNSNPITCTSNETGPRQEQVKTTLLCGICEDRFNRNGEKWILDNGYRLNGPSNLYRMLQSADALPEHPSGTVYAGSTIPGLDMEKLSYFGVSVFWRASLDVWTAITKERSAFIDLGSYSESLRLYLLGGAEFPRDIVLWIAICRTPEPPPIMDFPRGHRLQEGYYQHDFGIPGLSFTLFVGKQLPANKRALCAIRSAHQIVFFTPIQLAIDRRTAEFFSKSPPSPALRKMHRKITNEELP